MLLAVIFHGTCGDWMTAQRCNCPSCWYPFWVETVLGIH